MLEHDRSETIARYRERYRQFGYDPRTLGWNKGRQQARFAAVLDALGRDFASILDVGCGFGDLFGHLTTLGWRGDYLGGDNWEFVRNSLGAMWERTSVAIASDFLSATADRPREELFHVDAGDVLKLG